MSALKRSDIDTGGTASNTGAGWTETVLCLLNEATVDPDLHFHAQMKQDHHHRTYPAYYSLISAQWEEVATCRPFFLSALAISVFCSQIKLEK